jgi:hypothetical protein
MALRTPQPKSKILERVIAGIALMPLVVFGSATLPPFNLRSELLRSENLV